jgi:simple sugar transport system substrate-binding protein
MKKRVMIVATLVLCLGFVFATTSYGLEKLGKGVKIYFFCGGPEGGSFASVVYKGALQAEYDLGADVEYVWSDWNVAKMIADFKDAMAANPDGIAIMGHPGDDAFAPLVDQAIAKGIIVTSQNTDLPSIEAKYTAVGFGYVGQELYASGLMLARHTVKLLGLGDGDRALVYGLLSQPTRGLRSKGCIDGLEKAGVTVDYIEISDAVNTDPPLGAPVVAGYIAAHPDVKLVITDHGGLTGALEMYFKTAGVKPGEIAGAGFDLSAASVEAIRDGYTVAVHDQQPYLQGYLPIVQICLTKKYGFAGLHINTGSGIVDASNVEPVAALAEQGIR